MVVGSTSEAYVAKSKTNRPHEEFLITTNVAQLENSTNQYQYDNFIRRNQSYEQVTCRNEAQQKEEQKKNKRRRTKGQRESVYIRTPHARMNIGKT